MTRAQRRVGRRRWPFVVVGSFLAMALLAAATWFIGVPRYRPPLQDAERYGIDVSAHQGTIDWPRVAGAGIDVAYIKASEGGDLTDRRFAVNWRGAGEAGISRGAYHFFTLCRPAADQARHFLATAAPDPTALAPAVDLELVGNCGRRPARDDVLAELRTFLDVVERAWGRAMVVYLGPELEARYRVAAALGRPLWLRRFLRRPSRTWTVWQVDGFAHVDGIDGSVDLDVVRPFLQTTGGTYP